MGDIVPRRCYHIVQALKSPQITNTVHGRTEGAILLVPTGSSSGSKQLMCLRNFKLIVRTQWTVLPTDQPVE